MRYLRSKTKVNFLVQNLSYSVITIIFRQDDQPQANFYAQERHPQPCCLRYVSAFIIMHQSIIHCTIVLSIILSRAWEPEPVGAGCFWLLVFFIGASEGVFVIFIIFFIGASEGVFVIILSFFIGASAGVFVVLILFFYRSFCWSVRGLNSLFFYRSF